jgi:hypothetical protein
MSFTREIRLGDDIDDYCVRCKRVMNHNVVSVLNGKPAKVRCRTCHSDHDFRNEQPPPPKVDPKKAALFNEVLKKVSPGDAAVVEDEPDLELESDGEPEADAEAEEQEAAAAAPAPAEEPAGKSKRGRGRPKK